MSKKATLIHHQGFGDLFTSNPIINYYSKFYDEIIVFVSDINRKKIVDHMFFDSKNVKCEIPKTIKYNLYNSSCLNCMTPGSPDKCPRDWGRRCEYIDYSFYNDYENIKIGCFNNYEIWEKFLNDNLVKKVSFSHSFYLFQNIDLSIRESMFTTYRDFEVEKKKYYDLNQKNYLIIHDDPIRNLRINLNNEKNLFVYQLNGSSDVMIDQIKILENAKEIHMIDSSYSVMVYFLSLINEKISKIPKFLYKDSRTRDFLIYENPTPKNWNVI